MILQADARHIPLSDGSVHCCVTSPPYFGLRDYGLAPQVWGGDAACEHVWDSQSRQLGLGGMTEKQVTNRGATGEGYRSGDSTCRLCEAWRGTLGLEPTPELYVA